jgi:hypothetical protein
MDLSSCSSEYVEVIIKSINVLRTCRYKRYGETYYLLLEP